MQCKVFLYCLAPLVFLGCGQLVKESVTVAKEVNDVFDDAQHQLLMEECCTIDLYIQSNPETEFDSIQYQGQGLVFDDLDDSLLTFINAMDTLRDSLVVRVTVDHNIKMKTVSEVKSVIRDAGISRIEYTNINL